MAYKRKTRDVWTLYVDYGYGWEYEIAEFTLDEARMRMQEYRENCPQYPVKIVKSRERIDILKEAAQRLIEREDGATNAN